ncbi:MAG: hypothetical protein KKA05_02350 [Alphaproteobacteria bacterium]|nr:hypothetical protein [Alphaproteobacteria bacterium]MBU0860000.1 hypothetical protein [Alphaproteobacteria bacterium]
MKHVLNTHRILRVGMGAALLCAAGTTLVPLAAQAATDGARSSPLVITNAPLPPELRSKVYSKPTRAPTISPAQVSGASYYGSNQETVVGRKVGELRGELFSLQGTVANLSERMASLQASGQNQAAEYYASVATISTQLQTGTTPGNPRLIAKLDTARNSLEQLSGHIASLNELAVNIANAASMASFLLESSRSAYSLSGAVEEDHVRLAQMEDAVNNTVVVIERLLNNVNDDITRTVAYLNTERDNLRTLSLAINTGDLFGKNLSNRPFSRAQQASFTPQASSDYGMGGNYEGAPTDGGMMAAQPNMGSIPGGPRPLVKIRFDRTDVEFEQPVYMAVNEALTRYPNAKFELVAVHPNMGNTAEVAIESTRARRNAEKVLRSLTEMGLPMDRVDLSYSPSPEATTNEVHLYVR